MGGGSSQGSGWTWIDIGAIGQFQKGEEVVQPSPQKQTHPPGPSPEAAQEALPQALAPAEVAHPIPNQEEVAALRRELHGLVMMLRTRMILISLMILLLMLIMLRGGFLSGGFGCFSVELFPPGRRTVQKC